ncbi:MAG: twin-arginine translocation signal domain-containing protein [Acidimicrobiales bacterium]
MESISRRTFLQQTGSGAAAVGAFSALSKFPGAKRKNRRPAVHDTGVATPEGRPSNGPLVVHIPDPRSGQVHLMFGTREVVQHDPALVARLVHAAR